MLAAVSAMPRSPRLVSRDRRIGGRRKATLCQPFDDAQIALGRLPEHFERGLITLAIVGGGGFFHAVELDHHHALRDPRLIGLRGVAAREKAPASGGDCRPRELGIGRQCIRIRNRAIERDPIRLCHCTLRLPLMPRPHLSGWQRCSQSPSRCESTGPMLADKAWTDMAKTRAMSAVAHKTIAPFLFAPAALRLPAVSLTLEIGHENLTG